jgi:ankyrin repeat protein
LAIGLRFTVQAPAGSTEPRQIIRKFLESSARRGNYVACGLASRLCKILGDFYDHEEAANWLETAVDTGSVRARADLRDLDGKRLSKAIESFRNRGGYNMTYWDLEYVPDVHVPLEMDRVAGQNRLHGLAAFGSCEELGTYLDEHPGLLINELSERGETALYVACARGSWKHAELLLGRGADPSLRCTASETTCLHWIFAFDSEFCGIAVKKMLAAEADINALIPPNVEVPFPHSPFVLPAGTPLHWAVATSSQDAIRALIEADASPLLRNGSDPYMYDDRIRHLYAVGGPDAEGCTFAEPGCLGLSAMDLAAIHRDPFLLQLMVERKDRVNIHSADEEGFTVLHRLATSQTFRTSRRMRYSVQTFRGLDEAEALRALIVAIKSLGGDIERLTSSADTAVRKEQRSTDLDKSSYTPLMLAMLEADHDTVQALLDCGASVNTENASQTTAMYHLSHRANAEQPQLWQCIQNLIDHGANVNHRSSTGNTPLLTAAHSKLRDIFDFLLSRGAHIDDRDETPRTATPGKSVFAFFASTEESSDGVVLDLLTRYVFHSSEPTRKRRVMQDGSDSGCTLLHECAAFAMPKCVKALLHNGARVNALERKTIRALKNGGMVEKEIWYETPLDRLESTRNFKLKMVMKRKTLSTKDSDILRARWKEVEEHLKRAGGMSCTPDMICEEWS